MQNPISSEVSPLQQIHAMDIELMVSYRFRVLVTINNAGLTSLFPIKDFYQK